MALGNLGDLLSLQGRDDEAREAFRAGEAILRKVGSTLGLVKLLSDKGQAAVRAGELDLGRSTLAEVETVAAAMNAGPEVGALARDREAPRGARLGAPATRRRPSRVVGAMRSVKREHGCAGFVRHGRDPVGNSDRCCGGR